MYHLRMSEYRSMTQLAHSGSRRSSSFQPPDCTGLNSLQPTENTVASLGLVSPEAVTDGVTLYFS